MAMNRIQFQPGLSLTQFLEQYGTEERCEQALEQGRWPEGYLGGLLIHGARNVIYHIRRRLRAGQPGGNAWVEQLLQRTHPNAVAVALANKMARIAWVLLVRNQTWCPARPV